MEKLVKLENELYGQLNNSVSHKSLNRSRRRDHSIEDMVQRLYTSKNDCKSNRKRTPSTSRAESKENFINPKSLEYIC